MVEMHSTYSRRDYGVLAVIVLALVVFFGPSLVGAIDLVAWFSTGRGLVIDHYSNEDIGLTLALLAGGTWLTSYYRKGPL